MNGPARIYRLAERELNEAAQYYDLENPGLGSAFLEVVDRCLESIEAHPEYDPDPHGHGPQVASYVLGGTRVTSLRQPNFCFQPTDFAGV